MDVTSYLLGKQAGGGGGSFGKITPLTLDLHESTSNIINTQAVDTSRLTNMANMFKDCPNVETLDLTGWNFENTTTIGNMFNGCLKLKEVKANEINAINSLSFANVFSNCPAIETIPYINAPKTTNFSGMFYNVGANLTDESLDNILRMCISAVSYNRTKSLYYIGLSNRTAYSTSRIEALPHYQDFINAGWTID